MHGFTCRWMVRHFSQEGDTVLSLCSGTGSTSVAALMLGRNAIDIDFQQHQLLTARKS